MVDIFLRAGLPNPNDVALCDPTVPCAAALTAWGWDDGPAVRTAAPRARFAPWDDPIPQLPTPALAPWGWDEGASPARQAPLPRRTFDEVIIGLPRGPWGWDDGVAPARRALRRGLAKDDTPLGTPRIPWGWDEGIARARENRNRQAPFSDVMGSVVFTTLVPWGWESNARARLDVGTPLSPTSEVFPPFAPEPPGPPPELAPVAYPSFAGGGAGGMLIDPAYETPACDPDDPDPYMLRICEDVPDDFDDPLFPRDDTGFVPAPSKPTAPKPQHKKRHVEKPFTPNRNRIVAKAPEARPVPTAMPQKAWWTGRPILPLAKIPTATIVKLALWLFEHWEE